MQRRTWQTPRRGRGNKKAPAAGGRRAPPRPRHSCTSAGGASHRPPFGIVDGGTFPDMTPSPHPNTRSVSTTWKWKRCILEAPAHPPVATAGAKRPRPFFRRRSADAPLTITVRYLGGPECWWEIKTRGETIRVPGHEDLATLLFRVNGWR